MKSVRRLARAPAYLKRRLFLHRSIIRLKRRAPELPEAAMIDSLIAAWGSEFTADRSYAAAVAEHVASADGPVLECGSGLTTIIAAIYSRHGVWSLEHLPKWFRRVRSALRWAGLRRAHVFLSPLVHHGEFDWYDVERVGLPSSFALVICDGPPGRTRGGRFGLFPVLGSRIGSATVLLDDADRTGETTVLDAWIDGYGVTVERPPGVRYALVTPSSTS